MQWYYAIDDQRLGPVSHAELERLIEKGSLIGRSLVWRKGMDQWETLDAVKQREPELFASVPPPLPSEAQADAPVGAGESFQRRTPTLEPEAARAAVPEVLHYAGFWRRFGAHLVDLAIWWFVWQIFTGIVGALWFPDAMAIAQKGPGHQAKPEELIPLLKLLAASVGVGVVWAIIYDLMFIPRLGATPGKLLFGLRVVKANGRSLGALNVVARCLCKGVAGLPTLCIGYLVVAFDDQKRSLHDQFAGTRVVRKREP